MWTMNLTTMTNNRLKRTHFLLIVGVAFHVIALNSAVNAAEFGERTSAKGNLSLHPLNSSSSSTSTPSSHDLNSRSLIPAEKTQSVNTFNHTKRRRIANLHKILEKLNGIRLPLRNRNESAIISTKPRTVKLLGVNKFASIIPSFIGNNTRLKRQLEGIFHVRKSTNTNATHNSSSTVQSTTVPPLPSTRKGLNLRPNVANNRPRLGLRDKLNFKSPLAKSIVTSDQIPSQKDGVVEKKTETVANFHPKKSNPFRSLRKELTTEEVLDDPNAKRNYTVEIVEISRKTVIKEDNKSSGKFIPTIRPFTSSTTSTVKPSGFSVKEILPSSPVQYPNFKRKLPFKFGSLRSRIGTSKEGVNDSHGSATQPSNNPIRPSVKYKTPLTPAKPLKEPTPISTTEKPLSIKKSPSSTSFNPRNDKVEVKVNNYNDQIPQSEKDINQADLQDYLDGHSTFGAKGNFKHAVATQPTPVRKIAPKPVKKIAPPRDIRKRQQPHIQNSPQRLSSNEIDVEKADVRQRAVTDRATVYTATGVPPAEDDDRNDDKKNVFEYSGKNKEKDLENFPKLSKSTLDALYKQGHPAVVKPPSNNPETIEKGLSLTGPEGFEEDYNPFGSNPLVDEPPQKFDPESDRFYGNPRPDRDRLAQSNRPEPVQVENNEGSAPDYEEEERKPRKVSKPSPRRRKESEEDRTDRNEGNNEDNDRFLYERVYEPPEDRDGYQEGGDDDTFIKDFVSLDNNFQTLPRPTEEEESFRTLLPPEAVDERDERKFEPDERRRKKSRRDDQKDDEQSNNSEDDELYDEPDDYTPTEDFDQSYVDALKQFDDEIKKIEENERNGITTGNPNSNTGGPLVITSPGPSVSYQEQQRNAPPPPQEPNTTPTNEEQPQEEEEEEEEEEEPTTTSKRREDEQEQEKDKQQEDENEEEEEESEDDNGKEEEPEEKKDKDKNADESQTEHVKVNKVVEVKTNKPTKEDKSGDLDEDISKIEQEFRKQGKF